MVDDEARCGPEAPRPEPLVLGGPSPFNLCVDPCWVPGGIRIRFEPFMVGTSMVAPWIASVTETGRSTSRLPSGRWRKTGDGATRVVT